MLFLVKCLPIPLFPPPFLNLSLSYLHPVENKFFFERKPHGFFLFPAMSEGDDQLDINPPSFKGVMMVLNVDHPIDRLNYSVTRDKLSLAQVHIQST